MGNKKQQKNICTCIEQRTVVSEWHLLLTWTYHIKYKQTAKGTPVSAGITETDYKVQTGYLVRSVQAPVTS